MSHTFATVLVLPFLVACEAADNSAVRSFHAGLKPGMPLLQAVQDGERTQKEDLHYLVAAEDCPGPYVEVGRGYEILHVRITKPSAVSNPSTLPGYTEVGYASRDEFAQALADELPEFYSCESFRFEFSRDHVWPTSDTFVVRVDSAGTITSVSELSEE